MIFCSRKCSHQKDGYCGLGAVSAPVSASTDSDCVYFSPGRDSKRNEAGDATFNFPTHTMMPEALDYPVVVDPEDFEPY